MRYLIGLQLVSRIITFAVNALIARKVSIDSFMYELGRSGDIWHGNGQFESCVHSGDFSV